MYKLNYVLAVLLIGIVGCYCHDVFFGVREIGDRPIYREKVEYNAIPWIKRVKYFFYNDTQMRTIKAILCYDHQKSEASVNVTAGGIGHSFVNLRMKSQRSYGLEYYVEIYAV